MPDAQNLARNIATARNAVGWSRERLAEELRQAGLQNWHATTVARVETEKREVRVGELTIISRVFTLAPEVLLSPPEQFGKFGQLVRASGRFTDAQSRLIAAAMARVQAADELRQALQGMPSSSPAWDYLLSKSATDVVRDVERVLDAEKRVSGEHQEEA